MTAEEAIKELKNNYVLTNGTVDGKPIFESIEKAIEALEKQEPKKCLHDGYTYRCPVCNTAVEYECDVHAPGSLAGWTRDEYRGTCGQAIDWSEVGR